MGYTHYWYMEKDKEVEEEVWDNFTTDAKSLIEDNPILEEARKKYDGDGYFVPTEIDNVKIRFDGGHETFWLERKSEQVDWRKDRNWVFNFCKTARKEYDGLVTATLLLAKHHLGNRIRISSDGDINEWIDGAWEDVPSGYRMVQDVISEEEAHVALRKVFGEDRLFLDGLRGI